MNANPQKILIVEDEALIALDIKNILRNAGYPLTQVVDSGEAALVNIDTNKPDLVLMDINLGGDLDGIETTRCINLEHADIPVIYLTSYANPMVKKRVEETKYFEYMLKPFNTKIINELVDSVFQSKAGTTILPR